MKVLNLKHLPGRKTPSTAVYIGRPSKWGNPFAIGEHGTREQVIKKYERYIKKNKKLMKSLGELVDKDLVCWCHPLPCHGDVLKKLVEELNRTAE